MTALSLASCDTHLNRLTDSLIAVDVDGRMSHTLPIKQMTSLISNDIQMARYVPLNSINAKMG
jgi:hypothetical protein